MIIFIASIRISIISSIGISISIRIRKSVGISNSIDVFTAAV